MKRVVFLISSLLIVSTLSLSAKKLPTVAAKLPSNLKQEIMDEIDYPDFAQDELIEGEVWMKVCVSEESKVQIIDLSATNQKLGSYVKSELSDLYVDNPGCDAGQVFYLKVDFNLLESRK